MADINLYPEDPKKVIGEYTEFFAGQLPTATDFNRWLAVLIAQGDYNTAWLDLVAQRAGISINELYTELAMLSEIVTPGSGTLFSQRLATVEASISGGAMVKTVYDTDNDGIVDNSERLGGQLPAYYAKKSDLDTTELQLAEKASEVALAIERARIDVIEALPDGATTNDARLEDIKVGANGVTYSSPAEAMRTQIGQLKERISYKKNILALNAQSGYWNKDVNNNLNPVANSDYRAITAITLTAGVTYAIGVVLGYYSWVKKTSDGTLIRLYDTAGVAESTYTITPLYECTLWLSAHKNRMPYVMVIENSSSLPSTYKLPNTIYDVYVKNRLIDNIDKISGITTSIITGKTSKNILNTTYTAGYYWKFTDNAMVKNALSFYSTYESVEVKAGVPYTVGKVFGRYTWIYDLVTKTATYLDSVDGTYKEYTFTPTNDSLLYITSNSAVPMIIENSYELPNYNLAYGINYNVEIDGINKLFTVGIGQQYQTLTDAIADAVKYPNSIVDVKGGTYDLYAEQGGDTYFDAFTYSDASPTFRGIELKNNIKVVFSSDSRVVFNYTGSNAYVMQYYSPFNAGVGIGGFTLENLNLECSKCRYGVHDERGYTLGRYKNSYINCNISLDNSGNTAWSNKQCIGGGLGISGYIVIDGCIFNGVISTPTNLVSYHNNGASGINSKSKVIVKNSWFSDKGYFAIRYYGTTTEVSEAIITNCSFTNNPTVSSESGATVVNVKLTAFSNELRV